MSSGPEYNPFERAPSNSPQEGYWNPEPYGQTAQPSRLESLVTAARAERVKAGRTALIVAGVVIALEAALGFFMLKSGVDKQIELELQAVRRQGMDVDHAKVAEFRAAGMRAGSMILGGIVVLAVVFFVLAAMVKTYPLGAALTGLILYIGFYAVAAAISENPIMVLVSGWLWKIIVIGGLIKAIQAGVAANTAPAPAA